MPVLVSMVSVIVRRAALEARWPGGAAAFLARYPAWRTCHDGRLAAVRLDDEELALAVLHDLQQAGIHLFPRRDGDACDAAVVSVSRGPASWWPWLELSVLTRPGGERVLAAREAGDGSVEVAAPPRPAVRHPAEERRLVELRAADRPLRFVRRAPDAAVYLDRMNGEEVRVRLGAPAVIEVRTAAGGAHPLRVDLARTTEAIEVGLMHRDALEDGAGMLFLFREEAPRTFWMKNTRIPLDMLFLRADGTVADVVARAPPMSLRSQGGAFSSAVLEVSAGWAEARAVRAGDRVVRVR